jgi:CRISPR-associated protein Cas1
MKKLLNTLYVTTQGAYLTKEGETVQVRVEHETVLSLPIHTLDGIVCFGQVSMSPPLMGLCGERGVTVAFMNLNGRFLARVDGPVSGNVLLRRRQYRWADDEERSAGVARWVVAAKIANSRMVLQRALRDYPDGEGAERIDAAQRHLSHLLQHLKQPGPDVDRIRGWEGEAANAYFGVFDHLITGDKESFAFTRRSRRPPLDPVNALISFLYTLLAHDVRSALEGVGLDPAVGYLHRDRPGRHGLALDLMEELRAYLADRLALSLINRRQVKAKGFQQSETGAVVMGSDTRKTVLVAYQERKRETITHPFLKERIEIGLLPHTQALLMARHIRGDLESYPPFVWR